MGRSLTTTLQSGVDAMVPKPPPEPPRDDPIEPPGGDEDEPLGPDIPDDFPPPIKDVPPGPPAPGLMADA